jgi:hypothetical protein
MIQEEIQKTQKEIWTPLMNKVISIKKTSELQRKRLKAYSNSRLESVNQCPMWGVISSQRRYDSSARSMALEAGEVMHQVFATTRVWQLYNVDSKRQHAMYTGERIFGYKRWHDCLDQVKGLNPKKQDEREHLLELNFAILASSGFVDNPDDQVRTLENMQLATICYVDECLPKMENWAIYVEDDKDPRSFVGIEQVFDVVITFEDGKEIRYIGTVDGLVHHIKFNGAPVMDENKTAARLDAGWRAKWELSHQISGYCFAASVIFGFPIVRSRVTGVKIKPTHRGEDVYVVEPLVRDEETFEAWAAWFRHTVDMYEQYVGDFERAPRYTHSCNRYFRPCALIPFCCDSKEGRQIQFQEMIPADKSPSERAVMEG